MSYNREILDRKVGRNAQLFARAIASLDSARARFPYLRILICLIEKAHPEWERPEPQPQRVAQLAKRLSGGTLCPKEVTLVAQVRGDEQRVACGKAPLHAAGAAAGPAKIAA